MTLPGFTADAAIARKVSPATAWAQELLVAERQTVVMAKLPGGASPGVEGKKCTACSGGWRSCEDTIDAIPIGPSYKEPCCSCGACGPTLASGGNFVEQCNCGGQSVTRPCSVCKTMSLPWPFPDFRVCCNSVNLAQCTFNTH
jgi:hypothetical protein